MKVVIIIWTHSSFRFFWAIHCAMTAFFATFSLHKGVQFDVEYFQVRWKLEHLLEPFFPAEGEKRVMFWTCR